MTKTLLDVVNFNADASCLPVGRWLDALSGGRDSAVCCWLSAYVEHRKKVSLGLIGATVAEVASLNPEAIELINANPDIFEIIVRPFVHDIALLRDARSFQLNVRLGKSTLERELRSITPYFLPPEFMLTNEQVSLLANLGVEGVFINSGRFRPSIASKIPTRPYRVHGVLDSRLACVPLADTLTDGYLESLHTWTAEPWLRALDAMPHELAPSWRDGESWLLFPDGLDRERAWLAGEGGVERAHLRDVMPGATLLERDGDPDGTWWSYPVHSFFEWVKEFRMFGYLRALGDVESRLQELSTDELVLWLSAAGSDVLSAVEKDDPLIQIMTRPPGDPAAVATQFSLQRSPRGFEGEEYLAILQRWSEERVRAYVEQNLAPHLVRLRTRLAYVRQLTVP